MSKVYFRKHHIDNISVKNKLLLIYVLCILIPVVLTYIIFLSMTENNLKNLQKQQINASLLRTKNKLYKGIDDAILTLYNIMTDRNIKDALDKQYDSYQEYYVAYNGLLRDALKKNNFIVKIINKVNIFTKNKTIPNSDGYTYIDDDIKNSVWYRYITAVEGKRFSFIFYEENEKRYFSLVKDLNHFANGFNFSNILKIDFMDAAIVQILNTEKISGEVYLVNEKNEIIYTTDKKYESTPQNVLPVFDMRKVGYEDPNYFITIFEKITNISPTQYRSIK